MTNLGAYVLADGRTDAVSAAELDALVARWPWFSAARIVRARLSGRRDDRMAAVEAFRSPSSLAVQAVEPAALTTITAGELIERFLHEENLRIVAEEGEAEEIRTEAVLDEEDEVVSEELAEIYLAQGLRDEALAIYRKLSLRNPEKSVYFAELIGKIETNN